jgi:TonB family protein
MKQNSEQQNSPPPAASAPRFSVDMEATVPSGGVAVPTGARTNALAAPAWAERDDPAQSSATSGLAGGSGSRGSPLEAEQLSKLPQLVSSPSVDELREAYPPDARVNGLEANVQLKILVSATGTVESVRVLKPVGNGFEEAARRLIKKFRFQAGRKGGKAVSVWIPWTYKFRLNG